MFHKYQSIDAYGSLCEMPINSKLRGLCVSVSIYIGIAEKLKLKLGREGKNTS